MTRQVKRYDPINSDGTCGMCIEDADYGAYVEYEDYAALEAELARVKGEYEWVASINTALDESNQSAWAENAKLRAELERRAVDGWKLVKTGAGCVTRGMKSACIGEFSFGIQMTCGECVDCVDFYATAFIEADIRAFTAIYVY